MAFWKVAGFAQPSPIEQILDKETFTLEELLDEDDLIQECKSLNGRLVNYLREKETVEKLLRYLVSPPTDTDDPKQQYKYPFTSCEVFCCEVEAIYNTLMEDDALLGRLFSLLDQPPPLSCKTAGYFGRVVGQLLLKKTHEMMQYLSNNDTILERFIQQIDTASIADVLKRLVGADDQAAMVFLPMHTQWLAETQLVDWLLDRLRSSYAPDVQSNAADILTAIAHTQPSPLSMQLMQQKSIAALFERALEPGGKVLVAALEVCGALLEPMRSQVDQGSPEGNGNGGGMSTSSAGAAAAKARAGAVSVMLEFVPQLVELLQSPGDAGASQETPYGLLTPPLGRARLKAVELLAALLRVGEGPADEALIASKALVAVQALFLAYPFNNLLHHQLLELLAAALRRGSGPMLDHLLGPEASLPKWLRGAPKEVTPAPLPGGSTKAPLRAGYLGHVTRIANVLMEVAAAREDVAQRLQADADWQALLAEDVGPRNQLEDVNTWQCGRPAATDLNTLDSDEGEYQGDMDLDQMQGVQPTLYHRYGVLDDDEEEEEEGANRSGDADFNSGYSNILVAAMANISINDSLGDAAGSSSGNGMAAGEGQDMPSLTNWSLLAHPGASSSAMDIPGAGMEDDTVVLAGSDDEGSPTMPFAPSNNSLLPVPSSSRPQEAGSSSSCDVQEETGPVEEAGVSDGAAVAATPSQEKLSPPQDDMVLLEEEDALLSSSPGVEVAGPPPVVAMEEGLESGGEVTGHWEVSSPSSSEASGAAAVEVSDAPTPPVAGVAADAATPAEAGEGDGAGGPGSGAAAADSAGALSEQQAHMAAA